MLWAQVLILFAEGGQGGEERGGIIEESWRLDRWFDVVWQL